MKLGKKSILFFAGFIALILFCGNVSAVSVSDGTGDVWKQKLGSWDSTTSREDVDVTSLSYEISDSEITATLTVKGEIQSDANHMYYIYLENSSVSYYAMFAVGQGTWINIDNPIGESGTLSNPVSGNTFTATFEISNSDASFDLWGYAMETVGTEAYHDYAPNSYAPYYEGGSTEDSGTDEGTDSNDSEDTQNGEDNTGGTEGDGETDAGSENTENTEDTAGDSDSGTPGFEILTLVASVAIALILLRKRK